MDVKRGQLGMDNISERELLDLLLITPDTYEAKSGSLSWRRYKSLQIHGSMTQWERVFNSRHKMQETVEQRAAYRGTPFVLTSGVTSLTIEPSRRSWKEVKETPTNLWQYDVVPRRS